MSVILFKVSEQHPFVMGVVLAVVLLGLCVVGAVVY